MIIVKDSSNGGGGLHEVTPYTKYNGDLTIDDNGYYYKTNVKTCWMKTSINRGWDGLIIGYEKKNFYEGDALLIDENNFYVYNFSLKIEVKNITDPKEIGYITNTGNEYQGKLLRFVKTNENGDVVSHVLPIDIYINGTFYHYGISFDFGYLKNLTTNGLGYISNGMFIHNYNGKNYNIAVENLYISLSDINENIFVGGPDDSIKLKASNDYSNLSGTSALNRTGKRFLDYDKDFIYNFNYFTPNYISIFRNSRFSNYVILESNIESNFINYLETEQVGIRDVLLTIKNSVIDAA